MEKRHSLTYVLLVLFLAQIVSAAPMAQAIYQPVTSIICEIFKGVVNITGALASAIFMISGIKWIASRDDAGARNSARTSMIHAIIGLIIVLLAKTLVGGVVGGMGGAICA
ncbi:MAG: TrbC/VirB2 family protein [Methanobacteriota archaeon]